jgi:recombination protein RecR
MDSIERLTEQFRKFPGIGPRQAKRFVYFLLRQSKSYTNELAENIKELKTNAKLCAESYMYFYTTNPKETLSPIARNPHRDNSLLMIVEKDTDLESIERSGAYVGKYFVLGGNLPIAEKEPEKRIRVRELVGIVNKKSKEGLKEIIFALSANPEGEHTARYVKNTLEENLPGGISITVLGRGLSTGTELEYSDSETIKNALEHRTK